MKRMLSLFMALCLVVSLCGTMFVSVQAQGAVTEVNLSGITAPVAGQTPTLEGITCNVPGVTITGQWRKYMPDGGGYFIPETFQSGYLYALSLTLTAEEDIFSDELSAFSEGSVYAEIYVESAQKVEVVLHYPLDLTPITELNITGIGDTSVGSVITTQNLQAENANVVASYWVENGDWEFQDGVSTFEEGYIYILDTYLYPSAGYYFDPEMVITFEGQPYDRYWGVNPAEANVGYEIRHGEMEIEEVILTNDLPYEIVPGAAPQVNMSVLEGEASVSEIYWTDAQGTRITTFENGKVYYLNVALTPNEDYRFVDETEIYAVEYGRADKTVLDGDTFVASFRYSLLPRLEQVNITLTGVELGANIADVAVVADNPGVEVSAEVFDVAADDYVTTGTFQEGNAYELCITLSSEVYKINFGTDISINGQLWDEAYTSGSDMHVYYYASFKLHVDVVELTVPEPVIGQAPGEVTIPNDANYELREAYWTDQQTGEEMTSGDTFQEDGEYALYFDLTVKDGYDFAQAVEVTLNGQPIEWFSVYNYGCCMEGGHYWSFAKPTAEHVVLTSSLPDEIAPGAAPQVTVSVLEGEASVTEVYWTDKDWNRVTTFQEGKIYYLNVALAVNEGYRFTDETRVYTQHHDDFPELREFTKDTYIASFYYSLLPEAEEVNITLSGAELGKKIQDVTATVDNINADVSVNVYCIDDGSNGVTFEDDKAYNIAITIESEEYEFLNPYVTINGKRCTSYECNRNYMHAYYYFSTKEQIDKVELTVPEPAIGQPAGAVTAPANANYVVEEFYWEDVITYDRLPVGESFQDGHHYRVFYTVVPKSGYEFAEDAEVTLNGQPAEWYYVDNISCYMEGHNEWSFAQVIDVVALPALPETIQAGPAPTFDEIVTDKYTIQAALWIDLSAQRPTEILENGKSYYLMFNINAKEGYELDARKTRITAGGQPYEGTYSFNYDSGTFYSFYTLDTEKVLDRIDLNITRPTLGADPAKITAPQNDRYAVEVWTWFENTTGDIYNDVPQEVTGKFEEGKFYYAQAMLVTKNGYLITEDTEVYVNGIKASPLIFEMITIDRAVVVMSYPPLGDSDGDLDGDGSVNNKDVEYLLWHTLFPTNYPLTKPADFDGNGKVNNKDVEYLLWHTLFPGNYPLN